MPEAHGPEQAAEVPWPLPGDQGADQELAHGGMHVDALQEQAERPDPAGSVQRAEAPAPAPAAGQELVTAAAALRQLQASEELQHEVFKEERENTPTELQDFETSVLAFAQALDADLCQPEPGADPTAEQQGFFGSPPTKTEENLGSAEPGCQAEDERCPVPGAGCRARLRDAETQIPSPACELATSTTGEHAQEGAGNPLPGDRAMASEARSDFAVAAAALLQLLHTPGRKADQDAFTRQAESRDTPAEDPAPGNLEPTVAESFPVEERGLCKTDPRTDGPRSDSHVQVPVQEALDQKRSGQLNEACEDCDLIRSRSISLATCFQMPGYVERCRVPASRHQASEAKQVQARQRTSKQTQACKRRGTPGGGRQANL